MEKMITDRDALK